MSLLLSCLITAEAVTFNVKVPKGTQKCYVCGDFNNWNADNAPEMTSAGDDLFTLDMPDVSDVSGGFKYLCGRSWDYVEKDANGGEVSNRTTIGNPDIVATWRNVPEWNIESEELTINGIKRLIKVYLPKGYEESGESYPVIYYNTVQQRFNKAGDDGDPGDNFFGTVSWNAQSTMETLRNNGGKAYIMVQVCSFLGENTMEENPEFIGTGDASRYLASFVNELIPFVEKKWNIKNQPESRVIVGADYGALFSVYAALSHPEIFGYCVAMSPMLWINEGVLEGMVTSAGKDQKFYLTAGGSEPEWMITSVKGLYNSLKEAGLETYYSEFKGAVHADDVWGECFPTILNAINNNTEPIATILKLRKREIRRIEENEVYTLYAGTDTNNLLPIGKFVYEPEYYNGKTTVASPAYVYTNVIPASIKTKYYWNIAKGEDSSNGWLMESPKNVGFSSKKNTDSWHNIAISDAGIRDIAAHSRAFNVVAGTEKIPMTYTHDFCSQATVSFPGSDKSFTINYGSVNSASDMGALIASMSVSKNCVEAVVTYDFNLNKVSISETEYGESLEGVSVTSFTAVPAVCHSGTPVNITLTLNSDCNAEITCKRNSSENIALNPIKNGQNGYNIVLNDPQDGLYTFSVDIVNGNNRLSGISEINVRVLPEGTDETKKLTVNAYEGIDWTSTGRYKANFHTHTSQSFDTQYTTTEVVDRYRNAGYKILSLTDHDANSYPWNIFSLYNSSAEDRDPKAMDMIAIPGVELSKDRRNSWSESTGGEFNHHNDFFTGRKGQEFMSLRESYAYTQAIGGMQIINHPGQYWNLSTNYKAGEKNSPEWHAENFRLYDSLIGLEVYNQGNRRPNDRILWDQVLTINMPQNPVWGYSCDDTHTLEQYFRNYQFMLMDDFSVDALKKAMRNGSTVFSYEFTGSGKDKAPHINSINIDPERNLITIDSDDADKIEWIYSTHRTGSSASSTKSTVVGVGHSFNFHNFQGSYVRARLLNDYGETATQPFGFTVDTATVVNNMQDNLTEPTLIVDSVSHQDAVKVTCTLPMSRISIVNSAGIVLKYINCKGTTDYMISTEELPSGVYVVVAATEDYAFTAKFLRK